MLAVPRFSFASHSIVLVHHHLDRYLHSCVTRPPRQLVRGGGNGNGGRANGAGAGRGIQGKGKGKGKGK